ncbi:transposase family protein [Streptomonospora algeriensis]|uniref:Transposase family protein n=1 Tax=Streptomonospora algeriensis TaxID=995084 RepID=A0ABW3BA10_9ACTN
MHLQSAMPSSALAAPATAPILPTEDADPRDRRGRRHPLSCVILTGLCAVLTGARCLAAIGQWAANAPPHTLARLGARITDPALGTRQAPSPATIRRVLTALDPQTLTASPAAEDIAVQVMDGTSLRGSATRTTPAGDTAAHVRVEDKAGEIDAVADLLADIDITGCVISAELYFFGAAMLCILPGIRACTEPGAQHDGCAEQSSPQAIQHQRCGQA